jgi:hypothetical protein
VSRPTPPKGDIEKLRRKEEAERTLADVEAEIDVLKYRPGKPIMIVCHRPKQGLKRGAYAEAKHAYPFDNMKEALEWLARRQDEHTACGHSFGSLGHGQRHRAGTTRI